VLHEQPTGTEPGQFIALGGGAIIGYAGADPGRDVEVCGMVHPGQRGRGVGTALLEAALGAATAMGRDTVLVICEDAAPLAVDWMRRRGGVLDSSELRMVLRFEGPAPRGTAPQGGDIARGDRAPRRVDLRASTVADRAVLRHLLADGFPGTDDATLELMLGRHDELDEQSLIAWDGTVPVGTMRLVDTPARSMIYGLVIDRRLRGQGYGGAAMRAALEGMRRRGVREVSLEVLPDNEPAVRLYSRLGFRPVTTYRYMRVGTDGVSAD
jgi:ribosomal protein S18 acetylase RimI-like enzyme